jgi:lysylphosphatidylglycerol synthetase-like protein (DUF2156 family)
MIDFAKEIKTITNTWIVLGLIAIVTSGVIGIYLVRCSFLPGGLGENEKSLIWFCILGVAWGCSLLFVARGLASRRSWSRMAAVLVCIIFLVGWPINMIVGRDIWLILWNVIFAIFAIIWLCGLLSREAKVWFPDGISRVIFVKQSGGTEREYTHEQLREDFIGGKISEDSVARLEKETEFKPITVILYPPSKK